jgi:hypothetical protein
MWANMRRFIRRQMQPSQVPAKHDEWVKLLAAVHMKLGDAGVTNQVNMFVNATTSGTFIVTRYDKTFARGTAVETFTWTKKSGNLNLYGYHVESNALVEN